MKVLYILCLIAAISTAKIDIDAAVRHLVSHAHSASTGYCAQYVRQALEAGGFPISSKYPSYLRSNAYMYHTNGIMTGIGFTLISKPSPPRKGDVYVQNRKGRHSAGHIAMYSGTNWISDFVQKSDNVYSTDVGEKYYYRYYGYTPTPSPTPTPTPSGGSFTWLPPVTGFSQYDSNNGYAGIFGRPVTGLRVSGGYSYKVHLKNENRWLPPVTGNNPNDFNNGYAGISGKTIDGVAISGGIKYAVHIMEKKKWLPQVTGYNTGDSNNGYAGVFGNTIDAVMIKGRTYATAYNK